MGNACERAEGDEASRGGRSGRKNRGKARVAPEDFFGHRKRGCEATSNPSFCAKTKSSRPIGRLLLVFLCGKTGFEPELREILVTNNE